MRNHFIPIVLCAVALIVGVAAHAQDVDWPDHTPTAAYKWLSVMLEAAGQDVDRIGARPTILSRQMAIPLTAMYDAWAAYDDRAVGSMRGGDLRRPVEERTLENKEKAIAYAMYRSMLDQYPYQADYIVNAMREMGYDPDDASTDLTTPQGIGNTAAADILAYRRHDGANQYGDEVGSNGEPYSDYTMYRCMNTADKVVDPDCWQPITFENPKGGTMTPGFLTAHWYRVKPFALERSDQFRPGPPPKVGSEQIEREVEECIRFNANLSPEEKAVVEFMRDGPRSTGQSGHWLRFSMAVSRRDKNDLDRDVKLFFTVGNVAFDAFIAAWDSKRAYDSSRPWTLVRHCYAGKTIEGWAGPGKGVIELPAEKWHPYSPSTFITPPFPGYVSGHSCVSGACAEILKLFTGSDVFGAAQPRKAGELTEAGFTCDLMQQRMGMSPDSSQGLTCDILLPLPTFTATAEMAGISRVMGGYHIQADNVEGLALGRKVSQYTWSKYLAYFDGTLVKKPFNVNDLKLAQNH